MFLPLNSNLKAYLLIVVMVLFFAGVLSLGVSGGRKKAQSEFVSSQAAEIVQALDFFYQDNNRFPTADEFGNSQIMGNYLTNSFGSPYVNEAACTSAITYLRPAAGNYKLNFCLLSAVSGFKKGWNSVSNDKN